MMVILFYKYKRSAVYHVFKKSPRIRLDKNS